MGYIVIFAIVGSAYGGPSALATAEFDDLEAANKAAESFSERTNSIPNAKGYADVYPMRSMPTENE